MYLAACIITLEMFLCRDVHFDSNFQGSTTTTELLTDVLSHW
jgi:hypothetical protein